MTIEHCTYCKDLATTKDHIIPKTFYNKNLFPKNIKKLSVPACRKCNSEHGKNEGFLFPQLAACLNPENRYREEIWSRALRGLKISDILTDEEMIKREKNRVSFLKDTCLYVKHQNDQTEIENFGPPNAKMNELCRAIKIDNKRINTLCSKIGIALTRYFYPKEWQGKEYCGCLQKTQNINQRELKNILIKIRKQRQVVTLFDQPGIRINCFSISFDSNVSFHRFYTIMLWETVALLICPILKEEKQNEN